MKRTAAILLALMTMAGSAKAMTVSKEVGPLLKEAQTLIMAKDYQAAAIKLNQAETVKSYPDDETVINQFRNVISAALLDTSEPQCSRDVITSEALS